MIRCDRDPAQLTAAERRTEIAEILAAGFLRLQNQRNQGKNNLDDSPRSEATCGSHATNPKSKEDAR